MADGISIPELASLWTASYIVISFLVGFVIGGITGYFGNWLWYRFGPMKHKPHITITEEGGNVSFSGVMTDENQERIYKSLRAFQTKSTSKEIKIQTPEAELSASSTTTEAWQ